MAQMTHQGSCHCGAVRFHVDLDLEHPAITCNCSICARSGTMLAFVPSSEFKLDQGEDNLTDYQFNKKMIHHMFCKTCGIKTFGRGARPDGSEMVAVNVRCLEDVDLATIPTKQFDGKAI
ncbi:MAG TPA: GFA family protein [Kofleriaceae bacterium]|nr:GFA family protein [Kofleriaceae bacterium]